MSPVSHEEGPSCGLAERRANSAEGSKLPSWLVDQVAWRTDSDTDLKKGQPPVEVAVLREIGVLFSWTTIHNTYLTLRLIRLSDMMFIKFIFLR